MAAMRTKARRDDCHDSCAQACASRGAVACSRGLAFVTTRGNGAGSSSTLYRTCPMWTSTRRSPRTRNPKPAQPTAGRLDSAGMFAELTQKTASEGSHRSTARPATDVGIATFSQKRTYTYKWCRRGDPITNFQHAAWAGSMHVFMLVVGRRWIKDRHSFPARGNARPANQDRDGCESG